MEGPAQLCLREQKTQHRQHSGTWCRGTHDLLCPLHEVDHHRSPRLARRTPCVPQSSAQGTGTFSARWHDRLRQAAEDASKCPTIALQASKLHVEKLVSLGRPGICAFSGVVFLRLASVASLIGWTGCCPRLGKLGWFCEPHFALLCWGCELHGNTRDRN